MAIRGGLAEFSVPELLQLLALQQKTGVLTLTHKEGLNHILFFRRGRVLAAADRRRNDRHAFMAYLFHNQFFTKDQVESVEDISRSTGQDIFTVILASGVMGRDRLTEEMQRFQQRVADELVNWQEGTYEFTSGDEKDLPAHGLALHVNPEELVLEAMRRADELASMQESSLAPNLLVARVKNAPRDPLPRECRIVLKMVDGTKTIQELCRNAPLGEFLTYEAITELLGRQQIMILDANEQRQIAPSRPKLRISWAALAAVLLLLVGSGLLGSGLSPLLRVPENRGSWLDPEVAVRRAELRAGVAAAAEPMVAATRP